MIKRKQFAKRETGTAPIKADAVPPSKPELVEASSKPRRWTKCDCKNTGDKSCRSCSENRPIPKSKNAKNLFENLLKK